MKVLLGMPTMGQIPTEMVNFLFNMKIPAGVELTLMTTSRQHIMQARNNIIRVAIENNFDYIRFLDDDNPPERKDILGLLLRYGLDIVTGLVPSRMPDAEGRHRLCIFEGREIIGDEYTYQQTTELPDYDHIFEITNCGFGCIVIKVDALKKIYNKYAGLPCEMRMMKYYEIGGELVSEEELEPEDIKEGMTWAGCYVSEDILCIERLKREGYRVFCEPDATCYHLGEAKKVTIKEHILSNNIDNA